MHGPPCQQANPVGTKFCNECGTSLSGDVTGTRPSRLASPLALGLVGCVKLLRGLYTAFGPRCVFTAHST